MPVTVLYSVQLKDTVQYYIFDKLMQYTACNHSLESLRLAERNGNTASSVILLYAFLGVTRYEYIMVKKMELNEIFQVYLGYGIDLSLVPYNVHLMSNQ